MKRVLLVVGGVLLFVLIASIVASQIYFSSPGGKQRMREIDSLAKIKAANQAEEDSANAHLEREKQRLNQKAEAEANQAKQEEDDLLTALVLSERYLKKNLKDPDSYEEIEHKKFKAVPKTDQTHYQVIIRYRAKNSFGGFVIGKRAFNFDSTVAMVETFDIDE